MAAMMGIFRKTPPTPSKVEDPNLGFLPSYARIAIHIGEFSLHNPVGVQNARNKIAQGARPRVRELRAYAPAGDSSGFSHPEDPLIGPRNSVSKNLDEIDLKILSEIQADGRITNVELAKRVGISPPPCLRRVRTLEEEGYIQGYRGLLDARRLGFDVTVFAAVHLSSQADADLRAFEEFVRAEPLVRECWMLSGEVDFILKCVAPDMATFQDFVTHLTAAPHVRNVRTSLVLHNSKYEAAVPLEVKARG
jgi:DNA-binding Lrp family transcriptional regulator